MYKVCEEVNTGQYAMTYWIAETNRFENGLTGNGVTHTGNSRKPKRKRELFHKEMTKVEARYKTTIILKNCKKNM